MLKVQKDCTGGARKSPMKLSEILVGAQVARELRSSPFLVYTKRQIVETHRSHIV